MSEDTFEDEATGTQYYIANVKIDRDHLQDIAPELELTAGMPASVFITTTTDRTVADYLIEPIRRSFERAFREN